MNFIECSDIRKPSGIISEELFFSLYPLNQMQIITTIKEIHIINLY